MANIMTKRGQQDNIVTYEHYCDTTADLANIPKSETTLGSTAIVLKNENDLMEFYIANSKKEWLPIATDNDSNSANIAELFYICSSSEYDAETFIPTIEFPEENKFYLTPNNNEEDNLFNEWIYVSNKWEKFGTSNISNLLPEVNSLDNNSVLMVRDGNWTKTNNYTPAANIIKSNNIATITLTDIDGTTSATIEDGITFIPEISSAGILSWTNNGGLQNPNNINLVDLVINAIPLVDSQQY